MSESIFKEIQDRFNIVDVARSIGLRVRRVGDSYRSDSIDGDGGENALAFYDSTNSWFDFKLQTGGDVTSLVARVKFDGSIKEAIHYLLPDRDRHHIDEELKAKEQFKKNIERWHQNIFDTTKKSSVNALAYLHKRGINDDTIRQLKIGVDPSAYGEVAEFRILFPYWDEAGKNILYFTSRRYDWSGRGENEHSPKYKNAKLDQFPFLRNCPLGLNTLKRKSKDSDVLVITEGVVDWLVFYQEGYSVLASTGGDFGKMWKEVLEKIKRFKKVILAFDKDDAGQGFTYKAAQQLIKHKIPFSCVSLLTKDVAEHYEVAGNLDAVLNSTRSGYRWLLNYITPKTPFEELTIGEKESAMTKCREFIENISAYTNQSDVHDLLISLRAYFPKDWISGLLELNRKGPNQADVAQKIISSHKLMHNKRTGFYEYQDPEKKATEKGIWKQIDDEVVKGYIQDRLGRFATGGKVSSIFNLIKDNSNVYCDEPVYNFNTLPLISFLNGTLHIDTRTGKAVLKPHSPNDYLTVQLPYYYSPTTKCPLWEQFVSDITSGRKDDQAVLQEFAGYTLLPNCNFQKALMLKGGGSNGKSVFFAIIAAVLGGFGRDGKGYVSSSEPSKWSRDFRLMSLRHSWVNVSSDMENDLCGAEGTFKKVVAGEPLEDSYKFKDTIVFQPRTKLMVGCNFFPKVNDTSDGFMRRWLIVEFNKHYVNPGKARLFSNDKEMDPHLQEKLMQELSGILNWMLFGLQRLLAQNHFTHTERQDELIREFRNSNNPLYSFVDDKAESFDGSDAGHIVPKQTVYNMFIEWADKNRVIPVPSNRFHSNLKSVFNNLSLPFDDAGRDWIFYTPEPLPDDSTAEM